MDDQKKAFLKAEFLTLSISGAFQHNSVYENAAEITDAQRGNLKRKIHKELEGIAAQYSVQEVSHEQHLVNIEGFQKWMEKQDELQDNISFGTAQKLLNLYLKYLWCSGWIEEPPHCPIDSWIIVRALKEKGAWTSFKQEDYERIIKTIEGDLNDNSIACWELNKWEELRNK